MTGLSTRQFLRSALRESATIASRRPAVGRSRVFAGYLPIKARQGLRRLRRSAQSPGIAHICDLTIHYPDLDAFVFMFEEIFIREDYRFTARVPDPLVIDCGSNIGMSVMYFKKLYPGCRVRAFEPDPHSYDYLVRNIATNGLADVLPSRSLLLDRRTTMPFTSVPGGLTAHAGAGSRGQPEEVASVRLSDFVDEPVSFLKLDVQGAETIVISELAAAQKLCLIDQMVIEYHHHLPSEERSADSGNSLSKILELLEAHGFDFQIAAARGSQWVPSAFQDVLIFAFQAGRSLATSHGGAVDV